MPFLRRYQFHKEIYLLLPSMFLVFPNRAYPLKLLQRFSKLLQVLLEVQKHSGISVDLPNVCRIHTVETCELKRISANIVELVVIRIELGVLRLEPWTSRLEGHRQPGWADWYPYAPKGVQKLR